MMLDPGNFTVGTLLQRVQYFSLKFLIMKYSMAVAVL